MIYRFILIPLIIEGVAQTLKLATDDRKGNITTKELLTAYGGFPSAHAAFVTSITTLIGLTSGIASPLFGLSFVISIIVIRDALGLRNILYAHTKYLNILDQELNHRSFAHLPRYRGHTPTEVIAGCVLGLVLTVILNQF